MTLIAYNKNIPDPPNNPSADVPLMKANTNAIDQIIAVDHVPFNVNDSGNHNFVHLQKQTSNPTLTAIQGVVFSKIVNSNTELFYRYGSAPQNTFQITNNGAVAGINGVSSLIGPEATPLKIQWGRATSSGVLLPNTTITFPSPFSSNAYSVNCTILTTDDSRYFVEIYDISTTQFRAVTRDSGGSKTSGITFCWMAIGTG